MQISFCIRFIRFYFSNCTNKNEKELHSPFHIEYHLSEIISIDISYQQLIASIKLGDTQQQWEIRIVVESNDVEFNIFSRCPLRESPRISHSYNPPTRI